MHWPNGDGHGGPVVVGNTYLEGAFQAHVVAGLSGGNQGRAGMTSGPTPAALSWPVL